MKRTILLLTMVLAITYGYAQHYNADHDHHGLGCSHVKSQMGIDFTKHLYNWQSPYLDDYDVTFYHLDIEVTNTSTTVMGNSTMHGVALVDLDTFAIELKDFNAITQILFNGIEYTNYDRINDNVIIPVNEITAGTPFTAQVFYNGTPPTGGFFSGVSNGTSGQWGKQVTWSLSEPFAASDWFPVKQDLEDKADSVWVFLTTESTNMAGSQGLLTNVEDLGNGKKRYEWKSNYPIAYYLISFAVSEYQEYNIYSHPDELEGDSILIQNFIYDSPGILEAVKDDIDVTSDMIEVFSELYMLYPFWEEKYGHCLTQLGGGMEHQTMSTMGGFSFGLVAHELGHMWFGDNVTCATWSDIWINEGFATYSPYLAYENIVSMSAAKSYITSHQGNARNATSGSIYIPEDQIYPGNEWRIFNGQLSYSKGACILHMLRFEIDNDDTFFEVYNTFQNDFTDSTATGDDFKNTCEQVTGEDWGYFFDQWYYGEGFPDYEIEYYNLNGKTYFSSLQSTTASTPFFDQHMELKLLFDDTSDTIIKFHQYDNLVEFEHSFGKNVAYIMVDPNAWNLFRSVVSVNINENQSEVSFRLAQTVDNITLYFSDDITSMKDIIVTDLSGKTLFSTQSESNSQSINTSELPHGVYLVRAENGNNRFVEKFVK